MWARGLFLGDVSGDTEGTSASIDIMLPCIRG
jgi:hypothetical protein